MPRVIAVCIDENRWTAAAAQVRGDRFTIERWLDGSLSDSTTIGTALESAGFMRDPVWIALGRGRVELRSQRLPPLPDEELPMAVRLQAMQQATTERVLCDYLPMRRDDKGVDVLVATCSGESADVVTKQVSPLKVDRLALRPLCSAAWLSQVQVAGKSLSGIFSMKAEQSITMLIDARKGEAEFIVFRDKMPVFIRNVRLPEQPNSMADVLAAEARRSLMASGISDSLGSQQPIAAMWGDATKISERCIAGIQTAIGGTVRLINPALARTDIPAIPQHAELSSVSAILGLLHAGVSAPDLLIDLQQPRKAPEPPDRTRTYVIAACAAASLVAFVGYLGWQQFATLDRRMAELRKENQFLVRFEEQAKVSADQLTKIEGFTKASVPWLERLAELAEAIPPGEDLLVDQITAMAGSPDALTLTVSGAVKDPLLLDDVEKKLDEMGQKSKRENVKSIENRQPYSVTFQESIRVGIQPRKELMPNPPPPLPTANRTSDQPSETKQPNASNETSENKEKQADEAATKSGDST